MSILADPGAVAWEVFAATWREQLHPRDREGKFSRKPGGLSEPARAPKVDEVQARRDIAKLAMRLVGEGSPWGPADLVRRDEAAVRRQLDQGKPEIVIPAPGTGPGRRYDATVTLPANAVRQLLADEAARRGRMGEAGTTEGLHGEDFPGHFAGLIAHQLNLSEGQDVKARLRRAHSAAQTGRWEVAIDHIRRAVELTPGDLKTQRNALVDLADRIQAGLDETHPPAPRRRTRSHPPEWVMERLVAEVKDPKIKAVPSIWGDLDMARQMLALGHVVEASHYLHRVSRTAEAAGSAGMARRYGVWAANLERWPEEQKAAEAAALTAFTKRIVTKGARRVPTILGGGHEDWSGQVQVWDEFPGDPCLLADIDMYSGNMRILAKVARDIRTDLDMTGEPANGLASWTVPLHELIHGDRGGYSGERTARIEAAVKAGEISQAERGVLAGFHDADMDTGDQERHVHPLYDVPRHAGAGVAIVEELVKRGYLERSPVRTRGVSDEGKPGEWEHLYGLTAKGDALTPRDSPGPDIDAARYNVREGKAIEEGYTELGATFHMGEWLKVYGMANRPTPYLAQEGGEPGKPDPKLAAVLQAKLDKLAGDTNQRHWAYAARALRQGSLSGVVEALRSGEGRRGPEDAQIAALVREAGDVFSKHPVPNPLYGQRRDQLVRHFGQMAEQLAARVHEPGAWAPDRIVAVARLHDAQRAAERAAADVEEYDLDGVLEELGTLQHLGDKELWTEAMVLRSEVDKLRGTSLDRYATAAEYAERLATDTRRLRSGDLWGHYPEYVPIAFRWCAAVAHAEGVAEGTPQWWARVRELADEVNREGTQGKIDMMARQVYRVAVGDPQAEPSKMWQDSLGLAIAQHWMEGGLADKPPWNKAKTPVGPFEWAVNWLENPPASLTTPKGYTKPDIAAAAADLIRPWRTDTGKAAYDLLAQVEAGKLAAADALVRLGDLLADAPDTASLHEVQDVATQVRRMRQGQVRAGAWNALLHPRGPGGLFVDKGGDLSAFTQYRPHRAQAEDLRRVEDLHTLLGDAAVPVVQDWREGAYGQALAKLARLRARVAPAKRAAVGKHLAYLRRRVGVLEPDGQMTMAGASAEERARLDARLAKAQPRRPALPPYSECVARAQRHVASVIAAAGTMRQGRAWYPAEHKRARQRADAYGVPVEVAAGVESATSPRTDYAHNQRVTDEILDAAPALAAHPAPLEATRGGVLGAFRRDGVAIALGGDLAEHLGGAKRRAFFNNIMWPGGTDDVTVDTWMLLVLGDALGLTRDQVIALGGEHPQPWTDGIGRMMIADAVRAAGRELGEPPDAVQAATWIAGRGTAAAAAAEDLDAAAYDADLILEYLADLRREVVLDLGPPHSGREDGSLAADDEAAWPLVEADPRFAAFGLGVADARREVQAAWDPDLHPRDKLGRFSHTPGAGKIRTPAQVAIDVAVERALLGIPADPWIKSHLDKAREFLDRPEAKWALMASSQLRSAGKRAEEIGQADQAAKFRALAAELETWAHQRPAEDATRAGFPSQFVSLVDLANAKVRDAEAAAGYFRAMPHNMQAALAGSLHSIVIGDPPASIAPYLPDRSEMTVAGAYNKRTRDLWIGPEAGGDIDAELVVTHEAVHAWVNTWAADPSHSDGWREVCWRLWGPGPPPMVVDDEYLPSFRGARNAEEETFAQLVTCRILGRRFTLSNSHNEDNERLMAILEGRPPKPLDLPEDLAKFAGKEVDYFLAHHSAADLGVAAAAADLGEMAGLVDGRLRFLPLGEPVPHQDMLTRAAAWDEGKHPRDLAGRFAHLRIVGDSVELYHGTTKAGAADAIESGGLTADRYSPYNRVLTARKDEAGYFATLGGKLGAVVTVRIPLADMDEYTDVNSQGLVSLRKPLPAQMIHKVERL